MNDPTKPNGHSGIHLLGGNGSAKKARDQKGRVLSHNATIQDATDIAIEVSEHYMQQVPQLVQAILLVYGIRPPVPVGEGAPASVPRDALPLASGPEVFVVSDPSDLQTGHEAPVDVAPGAGQEDSAS